MKQLSFFGMVFFLIIASCNIRNSDSNAQNPDEVVSARLDVKTQVQMIDSTFDFGKIKEGEKVVFSYRFKNSGAYPLIVSSASASCGCTIPEKPEQPIAPGESGFIKIVFNSKGTGGIIHKEVHVVSNAQPEFPTLILAGEVGSE